MWQTSYGRMTSTVTPIVPGSETDMAPADMKLSPRPGQPRLGFTGTVSTWTQDIRDELQTTVEQQAALKRNSQEAQRVREATSNIQQQRQNETNAALKVKINSTKEQLKKAVECLNIVEEELQRLQESLDIVSTELDSRDAPIQCSELTLHRRLDRPASEMTHDEVTRKLHMQIECLKQTKAWMKQAKDGHDAEIQTLVDCRYFLQNEIKDKITALKIDEDCLALDNSKVAVPETEMPTSLPFKSTASSTINVNAIGSPRYVTGNSHAWDGGGLVRPTTWAKNTKAVIEQAERTCATSRRLREKSARLAKEGLDIEESIHADLMSSVMGIVQGVRTAVQKMEESCVVLSNEINDKKQLTSEIQQSIDEKQAPAQVVQQRMDLRGKRPDMEMVEDPVQKALYSEWLDITKGAEKLKEKHKKSLEDTAKHVKQRQKIMIDLELKKAFLRCEEDVFALQSEWRNQ